MKDKLSSVLSEIKKKSFIYRVFLVLLLTALTLTIISFAATRQKSGFRDAFDFAGGITDEVTSEALGSEDTFGMQETDSAEQENKTENIAEKEYIPVGDIRIPHCGDISYSLSEKISDFYFENPSTNSCYLKVSITRLDTKENIYSSTLISPGNSISGVSLKLSRQASYKAMIKVDAYALDRMVHLNSLAIDTVIYVY